MMRHRQGKSLAQSFERSPSLDDGGYSRYHRQNQYDHGYPECPELLWVTTVSPQLSPADWGRLKNLLMEIEEPISPMVKVRQGECSSGLKRPMFVEVLLLLREECHRPAVPEGEQQIQGEFCLLEDLERDKRSRASSQS